MLLRKSYHMPLWMLSAAAAGFLTAPNSSLADSAAPPPSRPTTQRPASPRQPDGTPATLEVDASAKPRIVQAQASAPAAETDVQRELRRLYQESGREMPETPTSIQFQRPQGATLPQTPQAAAGATPSAPVQPAAQAPAQLPPSPTGGQPIAAAANAAPQQSPPQTNARPAPQPRSNPVTSFFKRFAPSSGTKSAQTAQSAPAQPPMQQPPTQPQTMPTYPHQPAPMMAQQPGSPMPRNYAPYNPQQPRRLSNGTYAPNYSQPMAHNSGRPMAPSMIPSPTRPMAAPSTAAPPTAAPPKSAHYAGAPGASFEAVTHSTATGAPAATSMATPATASAVVAQTQPTTTAPNLFQSESGAAEFEPPVLLAAPVHPKQTAPSIITDLLNERLDVGAPAAQSTAAVTPMDPTTEVTAVPTTFPDPFPEMSEEAADELDEEEIESPFVGLKLDDEPFPAKVADPLGDARPLATQPETSGLDANLAEQPAAMTPPSLAIPGSDSTDPAPKAIAPEAAPTPKATVADTTSPDQYAERMKQIRDRGGMKGLKGFCPVTLRDDRELKDSLPEFVSTYRGQKFHFASGEAKMRFDQNPTHYAPAAYGADVVVLIRDKDVAEGSLDNAAWYKGQLYLFANEETYNSFLGDPIKFAAPAGIE
jgi:YHS domain-containing protein